jgi:hypothetical protein
LTYYTVRLRRERLVWEEQALEIGFTPYFQKWSCTYPELLSRLALAEIDANHLSQKLNDYLWEPYDQQINDYEVISIERVADEDEGEA